MPTAQVIVMFKNAFKRRFRAKAPENVSNVAMKGALQSIRGHAKRVIIYFKKTRNEAEEIMVNLVDKSIKVQGTIVEMANLVDETSHRIDDEAAAGAQQVREVAAHGIVSTADAEEEIENNDQVQQVKESSVSGLQHAATTKTSPVDASAETTQPVPTSAAIAMNYSQKNPTTTTHFQLQASIPVIIVHAAHEAQGATNDNQHVGVAQNNQHVGAPIACHSSNGVTVAHRLLVNGPLPNGDAITADDPVEYDIPFLMDAPQANGTPVAGTSLNVSAQRRLYGRSPSPLTQCIE
jgi:hypothetical protein